MGTPTQWNPTEYDQAWVKMAAAGKDPHGEVAFVERLLRRTDDRRGPILDAGCGTGRVAIELDRRGHLVEGTDVDDSMLAEARKKAPWIRWHLADLSTLELERRFDVVVMAGNVILFADPSRRADVVARCAEHLARDGLLVAGFQIDRPGRLSVTPDEWDTWCDAAGLSLVERWSTWDEVQFDATSAYTVTVHRPVETVSAPVR